MQTVALIIAGFITLLLAGPATRSGLLGSWLLTLLSALPVAILYLAYRGDGDVWFLWPALLLLSITAFKTVVVLLNLHAHTPKSMHNTPVDGNPHWAV